MKPVVAVIFASALMVLAVSGCGGADGRDARNIDVTETLSKDLDVRVPRDSAADIALDGPDAALADLRPTDERGPDLEPDIPCPDGCDDGDPCTTDLCALTGCIWEAVPDCCPGKEVFSLSFDEGEAPVNFLSAVLVPDYPDQPGLASFTWQVSSHRFHSAPASLHFGGETVPTYDNGHRVAAEGKFLDLDLPAGTGLALDLWLYFDIEEAPYSDYFTIAVDVAGTRVPVWTRTGSEPQQTWFPQHLDLTPFAGQDVALIFLFDSHDEHENDGEGVFVDDVAITRVCGDPKPCGNDLHCDIGSLCLPGSCVDEVCQWGLPEGCCLTPADCEDWDSCTIEQCVDQACLWQQDPDPLCCNANQDCFDNDPVCTEELCENGLCVFSPSGADGCCQSGEDCEDDDPCTKDLCEALSCLHISLCCSEDADCDDLNDECTVDSCIGGACNYAPFSKAGCCVPEVLAYGFESGQLSEWLVESDQSGSGWHVVDTDAWSGDWSLYYGGAQGTYSSDSKGRITSPPIALPTGAAASVSAYLLYETEECCDKLEVALVDEGGERHLLGEVAGESLDWESWKADVSAFVGQTVHLEFFFESDGSLDGAGVHVDGVEVSIACCEETGDCDDGNPCTLDSCPGMGSLCSFIAVPGCCQTKEECDDQDPCTQDVCVDLLCEHDDLCCEGDADCDDADDVCTADFCIDSHCVYLPTTASGCCQEMLFADSFEVEGLDSYEVDNPSPLYKWHLSEVDSYSGSLSLAFSDLGGDTYGPDASGTVITPPVEIPVVDEAPRLEFLATYNTESCCDWWKVHLVVGEEWTELGKFSGEEDWQQFVFPLDPWLGQTVRVAFEFHSDGFLSYEGVFIDDLYFGQHCCSAAADCDDGDPCSQDICPGEAAHCQYAPVDNCCLSHEACDDGDECTHDVCDENQCLNFAKCCSEDEDCDDGEDLCTEDYCVAGSCKYEPQYQPTCCFPGVFLEDFDEALSDEWEIVNSSEEFGWRLHDSKSVTGDFSMYYGNLEGNSYGILNEGTFITPSIEVPFAPSVVMAYQLWSDTEEDYDELDVTLLWNDLEIPLETTSGSGIENWQLKEVDLHDYVGQEVRLLFAFHCDASTTFEGLWIDQLRVTVTCCDADEECLTGSPCIVGTCAGEGGMCLTETLVGCCVNEVDCDDADPCTLDTCVDGQCEYLPVC